MKPYDSHHTFAVLACFVILLHVMMSCREKNYFDTSHYEDLIAQAFPVENVDRGHTWTVVDSASTAAVRYCFEENFPREGDYDFNDVVLTVVPSVEGRTVRLTVSLDAVGAQGQIAAAIRVKGVSADDVELVSVDGDFDTSNGKPVSSFRIIDTDEVLLPDSKRRTADVVVRLFNDAHWAIGRTTERDGSVRRYMYNTVELSRAYPTKAYASPVSVVYTLQCASDEAAAGFVAGNMDAFIIESYNGIYMEVHTRPFKTDEVIFHYIASPSDYDDPYIWAIQLPAEFRYPTEGTPIGIGRSGMLSGAYHMPAHSFAEWAADHSRAADWWQYPAEGLVY